MLVVKTAGKISTILLCLSITHARHVDRSKAKWRHPYGSALINGCLDKLDMTESYHS